MNLFGKARASKTTPKDAIVKLRETLEMLEKREKYLQTKIDNELKFAKLNATKNKRGERAKASVKTSASEWDRYCERERAISSTEPQRRERFPRAKARLASGNQRAILSSTASVSGRERFPSYPRESASCKRERAVLLDRERQWKGDISFLSSTAKGEISFLSTWILFSAKFKITRT